MYENPDQPGRRSRNAQPIQIGYSLAAPNHRQISLVEIMKWLHRLAPQAAHDRARHVMPLLDRRLRHSRKRLASLMREKRQIADHENFRMPGHGAVRLHADS